MKSSRRCKAVVTSQPGQTTALQRRLPIAESLGEAEFGRYPSIESTELKATVKKLADHIDES